MSENEALKARAVMEANNADKWEREANWYMQTVEEMVTQAEEEVKTLREWADYAFNDLKKTSEYQHWNECSGRWAAAAKVLRTVRELATQRKLSIPYGVIDGDEDDIFGE